MPTVNTNNGNPFQNLLACFIVTDVQDLSFKVIANGVTIGHFINKQIVSWEVTDNVINIKTKDEVTYSLLFATVRECFLADQRIDDNMNGMITTGC